MLSKNIILNYENDFNNSSGMNKEDWIKYINSLFECLNSKPIGYILNNRMSHFLIKRQLIISNKKNNDVANSIYVPSFFASYKIPNLIKPLTSILGFTNEMKSMYIMAEQIYNYKETNFLLTTKHFNDLEDLIDYIDEDFLSIFVNQLIRILRFFEGISLKQQDLENGAIIYGINGISLKINNILITENIIRKEWNKSPRIYPIYFIKL